MGNAPPQLRIDRNHRLARRAQRRPPHHRLRCGGHERQAQGEQSNHDPVDHPMLARRQAQESDGERTRHHPQKRPASGHRHAEALVAAHRQIHDHRGHGAHSQTARHALHRARHEHHQRIGHVQEHEAPQHGQQQRHRGERLATRRIGQRAREKQRRDDAEQVHEHGCGDIGVGQSDAPLVLGVQGDGHRRSGEHHDESERGDQQTAQSSSGSRALDRIDRVHQHGPTSSFKTKSTSIPRCEERLRTA